MLANSRPELVIKDEKKITIFLLDIAVPNNIINTVRHIIEKVEQQWQVKAKVIPNSKVKALEKLEGTIREIRAIQKAPVLHTTTPWKIIEDRLSN